MPTLYVLIVCVVGIYPRGMLTEAVVKGIPAEDVLSGLFVANCSSNNSSECDFCQSLFL